MENKEKKEKKHRTKKHKAKDSHSDLKRVSEPISELGGDLDDDYELDYNQPEDNIQSYKEIPRLTVKIHKPNDVRIQGYLDK